MDMWIKMVGAGSAAVTCLIVDIFGDIESGLKNSSIMADFMAVMAQLIVGRACFASPWCALAPHPGQV